MHSQSAEMVEDIEAMIVSAAAVARLPRRARGGLDQILRPGRHLRKRAPV
jgi:hypothetical protein